MSAPLGVLVMAYGTASGPDDVLRYYTDIRGGRPPTEEHLRELQARYAAIGNRFPLLDTTRAQAQGLERALNASGAGSFRTFLGMKHSPPFVADGVRQMREAGIERGIGFVMAPHWSGMSIETYIDRVEHAAAEEGGPSFTYIRRWYDHPRFLDFLAGRVEAALATLTDAQREGAAVIFSAHSLPQRPDPAGGTRCLRCDLCPDGCRYQAELRDTAGLIGAQLGLRSVTVGWQSAGRTADPWLGPAVEEVIAGLAADGHTAAVVCSAGFVADHLEILYDLDIEARQAAESAGLAFARTEMPNADPAFIEVLAEVVRDHLRSEART